ncbi:MAG: hypothetical protein H8E73_00040 [Planctomycetes bacterium]|nr:hypothetical protein [Planctomycetota bacterium]MBL7153871.1 hypothetical protein [Phycisphaerae bacterium]
MMIAGTGTIRSVIHVDNNSNAADEAGDFAPLFRMLACGLFCLEEDGNIMVILEGLVS